ncbi:MAG: heavy metal translocating P-type ATPase metal-binding domain-containing protein [Verrucomicrobiaceae bacterium]|nr:heavy metal translocating P-type ATPase metal-binding domain-containing protein [Verrucomicrobiaceae bacterium]
MPDICLHCGTPVPASRHDAFCCGGCDFVYRMLHDEGLDRFYDLRGDKNLPPVPAQALRERDYTWLEQIVQANPADFTLAVQGMTCVGCVWLMEKIFSRMEGAAQIDVDVLRGEIRLKMLPGVFDAVAFAKQLQHFGYLVGPPQTQMGEKPAASGLERRMGVCGAFAMNAMAFSVPAYFGMPEDFAFAGWFDMIAAVSATLALLVGGSYFIERAWSSLRMGVLHIDTPIALGIIAAWIGSMGGWVAGVRGLKYFDFVAMFIFLMLVGRWAQHAAVERNRRKLMRDTSIPETVRLIDGEENLPLSALQPGMHFRVKSMQTVPVAAKLLSDRASVSMEWMNGESDSLQRDEGQLLPSGALNIGADMLDLEALETWESSTLKRLLHARRGVDQRDTGLERLLRWYLAAVVVVGICGAIWWALSGAGVTQSLSVMISIFVVSCPCALGVAVPLAEELASSRAERLGVFVRSLALWKRLMRTKHVIFDKTGTLTLENPALENPAALQKMSADEKTALRTLVRGNLHPVSRSLFDAIGPGLEIAGQDVQEVVGQGLEFTDTTSGHVWALKRSQDGAADAVLTCDGKELAAFRFRDALRAESIDEVRHLQQRGLGVAILSGDREAKVAAIAAQLGLGREHWACALTPEQKATWISEHTRHDALFIGDGANDSLAFDAALAAGSPVTGRSFLEQKADFFFIGSSLTFVSGLLRIARVHRSATRRVFTFSLSYNLITAVAGLMGHLSPLAAAVLMPLSSVATLGIVALTFRQSRMRVDAARTHPDSPMLATAAPAL